jgi:hypothetical protein
VPHGQCVVAQWSRQQRYRWRARAIRNNRSKGANDRAREQNAVNSF